MAVSEQVAIALDPPIRKGQTYYHHVLVQFSKDEDISVALDISDELLVAKNEKVCPAPWLQPGKDGHAVNLDRMCSSHLQWVYSLHLAGRLIAWPVFLSDSIKISSNVSCALQCSDHLQRTPDFFVSCHLYDFKAFYSIAVHHSHSCGRSAAASCSGSSRGQRMMCLRAHCAAWQPRS